ncbi:GntR family transcriptional regulator [Nocardioides sp. MAHUQ-72]|uniref:GntR family transcriptional regulator n=1 Tax=unclassified Nocardioides TaxID=2615069 RepID=UPI00360CEA04
MAEGYLESLAQERTSVGRSSTAARVADVLRGHVTEGRLLPGTRLSEEDIGEALGVSRNTLREAFRLLTHERLLVHEFNRGVFVRTLSTDDIRDVYRFRRILECAALRAATDLSPVGLASVRAAVEEGERAADAHDWAGVGTANMRFHQAIAGLAGSARVDETMRHLLAELRLVFHVMADPETFHRPYLTGNHEILELLVQGDAEQAEQSLATYLDVAETQLLEAVSA